MQVIRPKWNVEIPEEIFFRKEVLPNKRTLFAEKKGRARSFRITDENQDLLILIFTNGTKKAKITYLKKGTIFSAYERRVIQGLFKGFSLRLTLFNFK